MKRDMDLIRKLLVLIEETPFSETRGRISIPEHGEDEVAYHLMLLLEAGLIVGVDVGNHDNSGVLVQRLTYEGHEFLDAARSDKVWNRAKAFMLQAVGVLTMEGMRQALPKVVSNLIEGA